MKTLKAKWTGIRPLIMHNGQMADPIGDYAVRSKEINSKRKKELCDHEALAELEWRFGAYWSESSSAFIMPSDNIERCIQEGAKKNKLGKDFAAALICSNESYEVKHKRSGDSFEELYKDPAYQLRKGVKVQQSRIMRVRPMIPTGWEITVELEYDESLLNANKIETAMREAGALVGLGDWRPKFGRFISEIL